ncbi:MAG: peroxidase [Bryobacteraceae bacterium]
MESIMEPMFLRDVEQYDGEGAFSSLIRSTRSQGQAFPQIWHLFAFKPKMTEHLERFTQELMREEAPLSPGIRELIAAFTSYENDCPF